MNIILFFLIIIIAIVHSFIVCKLLTISMNRISILFLIATIFTTFVVAIGLILAVDKIHNE